MFLFFVVYGKYEIAQQSMFCGFLDGFGMLFSYRMNHQLKKKKKPFKLEWQIDDDESADFFLSQFWCVQYGWATVSGPPKEIQRGNLP